MKNRFLINILILAVLPAGHYRDERQKRCAGLAIAIELPASVYGGVVYSKPR